MYITYFYSSFSEHCIPVTYDSKGIVRTLSSKFGLSWIPVLDCHKALANKGDHYFVVGMTHNPNYLRYCTCIYMYMYVTGLGNICTANLNYMYMYDCIHVHVYSCTGLSYHIHVHILYMHYIGFRVRLGKNLKASSAKTK